MGSVCFRKDIFQNDRYAKNYLPNGYFTSDWRLESGEGKQHSYSQIIQIGLKNL